MSADQLKRRQYGVRQRATGKIIPMALGVIKASLRTPNLSYYHGEVYRRFPGEPWERVEK